MNELSEPLVTGPQPARSREPPAVNEESPWLGLDSFTEDTRQFFHGREEEIAELARRVQRKTLTILFGQSGLGKTSILRAGIVPRLRREGYCPVYVRIDYAPESPSPSQQIKQAIFRATEDAGRWTKPGSAVPGESLWEFLHHRDDMLVDGSGKVLTPLLIFDQFEEIFTLGQDDDFGRKRAAQFVEDLADLVENRAPKALEGMLETEDSIVERFDFNRADYRILIALREDYLAHLESFKGAMPSITQNRMRLARMTGQQALAAVVKPGGRLVSHEVAESIVRFVAGGAELRNAEVEPSLLSLVCRELNNARIAQGRGEISADLLAGTRDTILHEFYERAITDQPAGVRRFIEDEMLTESGHRESLAEERALKAFAAAGAAPDALATLVNRRLLRIEERLDIRRVELTHDVLCDVVRESRELRHEREAKEEAERQLAAQKAREEATRRSLVRARQVAAACAALAIAAIGSALFGYQNMKRAQEAEAAAQRTRAMAEGARAEAEKLIVYLLDDFYVELEPVGRLDIVADLSRRALDYYAGLPPQLRTGEAERNRALALARYGYVLRYQAKLEEAGKVAGEAVEILKRLRAGGDRSEVTAIGYSLALAAMARTLDSRRRLTESEPLVAEAVEVLKPLVTPSASTRLRRAYGASLNYLGFLQMRLGREEEAVKRLEEAREAYRAVDGLKGGNLAAAAGFAEASAWQMDALQNLGRTDEAGRVAEEALPVANRVLEERPGHMGALRSRALIHGGLARNEAQALRFAKATGPGTQALRDWEHFLKLDPGNTIAWNNFAANNAGGGFAMEGLGRNAESMAFLRRVVEIVGKVPELSGNFVASPGMLAVLESELGTYKPAPVPDYRRFAEQAMRTLAPDAFRRHIFVEQIDYWDRQVALSGREYAKVLAAARAAAGRMEALEPATPFQVRNRLVMLSNAHHDVAWAAYNLGDYGAAEAAARKAIELREQAGVKALLERLEQNDIASLHALALARAGRGPEALAVAEREIALHRELLARGSDYLRQHVSFARALLAAAIASPARDEGYLAEAAAILDRFPEDMKRRRSVAQLRDWIAAERKSRPQARARTGA